MQIRGVDVFDRRHPLSAHVVAAVALGGAVGAGGRWFVAWLFETVPDSGHPVGSWSWATLLVNVVGSLLIGLAARGLERDTVVWAFAVTGVLGGFTTFSTFAVELNDLVEAERLPMAIVYGGVTLAAGVGAATLAGSRLGSDPNRDRGAASGAT